MKARLILIPLVPLHVYYLSLIVSSEQHCISKLDTPLVIGSYLVFIVQ